MVSLSTKCILLDIEGTTSSVAYVFEVLFPFAKKNLHEYLERNWNDPSLQAALQQLVRDVGLPVSTDGDKVSIEHLPLFEATAIDLMERDVKATGVKEMQGLIWTEGYESGELKSHVYPDVVKALEQWKCQGINIRIFSSGSIHAQKVFFKNTEYGDLLSYFTDHYDTTYGQKREVESYHNICKACGYKPEEIAFLSDVGQELDAAKAAGIFTVLVVRPGNAPVVAKEKHAKIESFSEIDAALQRV